MARDIIIENKKSEAKSVSRPTTMTRTSVRHFASVELGFSNVALLRVANFINKKRYKKTKLTVTDKLAENILRAILKEEDNCYILLDDLGFEKNHN